MEIALILLILFFLLTPALILFLCEKYTWAEKIGPVISAYILGLILGNTGILPNMGEFLTDYLVIHPKTNIEEILALKVNGQVEEHDVLGFKIYKLKDNLMSVSVLLAIPLMLFSSNIKTWKKLAGKTLISLFLGLFSVLFMVCLGYFLLKNSGLPDLWKISGLLIGVYTGGTPNLASLKLMLDVDANTYILTHTYDLLIGVFYLAFLLSIGKTLFQKFLPEFKKYDLVPTPTLEQKEKNKNYSLKIKIIAISQGILLSMVIVGLAVGIASLLPEKFLMVTVILTITTLGIVTSLYSKINLLILTFETGMYFILIFSLVVASMADISKFSSIDPLLLAYISLSVFGSLALHFLLSRWFKVDADTAMITSVSFICSPPFVPVIAGALGNKNIIISGITVGIIGYAIGNYLGYFLANFLKLF